MVNNIKNNTISKIDAKKELNTLNKIKDAEIIKCRKRTTTQKELSNLFSNLSKTILTDNDNENGNENKNNNDNDNHNHNDNHNDNDNHNEYDTHNDNNNDNSNNNNNDNGNMIKELNNLLDKIIDKSKSFEDQVKLF